MGFYSQVIIPFLCDFGLDRSRGDLLLMILVHLMANYCVGVLGVPFNAWTGAAVACAAVIVAAGGLRAGARPGEEVTGAAPDRGG